MRFVCVFLSYSCIALTIEQKYMCLKSSVDSVRRERLEQLLVKYQRLVDFIVN